MLFFLQVLGSNDISVINDRYEALWNVSNGIWGKEMNDLDFPFTRQGTAIPAQLCLKLKVVFNKKFACKTSGSFGCTCSLFNYNCGQTENDARAKAIEIIEKTKALYSSLNGLGTTIAITYESKIVFPYLFVGKFDS